MPWTPPTSLGLPRFGARSFREEDDGTCLLSSDFGHQGLHVSAASPPWSPGHLPPQSQRGPVGDGEQNINVSFSPWWHEGTRGNSKEMGRGVTILNR